MPDPQGNPTLLDLIAEIEDDIGRADLNQQVRTAVNRAIRHHQSERLHFNERVLTFVTAPGVETYARGDLGEIEDLYAVDTLVLIEDDQPWTLQRVSEADIERCQVATEMSRPCRFSFFDRSIRVDPVPDAAYTLRLTGHVKIAAPAADGDTSPWVDEAGTLIAAWAKRHLAQNVLRDPVLAQVQEGAVKSAFNELRGRANRAASAGQIRAWTL